MGSDLYMESQNFRPRPTVAFLNGEGRWEVYRDEFYHGYNLAFEKPDNPTTRDFFKDLGYRVVDSRPVGVIGKHEKV